MQNQTEIKNKDGDLLQLKYDLQKLGSDHAEAMRQNAALKENLEVLKAEYSKYREEFKEIELARANLANSQHANGSTPGGMGRNTGAHADQQ